MNGPPDDLNSRLKAAVKSVSAPPFLESRIRANIQAAHRKAWVIRVASVSAAAMLCVGVAIAYQFGHFRLTRDSRESYIAQVSSQIAGLLRVGLRDHIHCAVFRVYPPNPPPVETMVSDMGPKYVGLMQVAADHVPKGYRLVMAHQCHHNHERTFVHLVLKKDGHVLSLLVATKSDGESFRAGNLIPSLAEAGIPIYRDSVQRFQIAAFESRDHLIYVISDLPQQQNTDMMLALAPGVRQFLQKLEI